MRDPGKAAAYAGGVDAARRLLPGIAVAALLGTGLAASAGAPAARPPEILVRLHAEGPHAVADCAASRWRRGERLAGATRDASPSLDTLHAELGVRRINALFRRPDARPFDAQRAALRERWERRRRALPARARARAQEPPELSHVYRIALAPGSDPAAAAARYAADPHVVWAQPNFAVALDATANDPFFSSSGSWGQPYLDLWGLHRVNAPAGWDLARGEGIVAAVVDSGVDVEHPDLAANIWVNPGEDLDGDGRAMPSDQNGVDDDANGYVDDLNGFDFANSVDANEDGDFEDPGDVSDADPFDDSGHGSHVAGTLAAVANNGIGIAGVAPQARIMALKGFPASGEAPDDVLARAMVYAIENGARVINNSWSCNPRCPRNPLIEDASALAVSMGVVVVTSAGNRSDDVQFYSPKNRRLNIVVAASIEDDSRAHFSNSGFLLDVIAPGGGALLGPGIYPDRAILSTRSSGTPDEGDGGLFTLDGAYWRISGTSMAAPHVAGIAALILSARPQLGFEDVRGVLRRSARDLGPPGHDRESGAGLADAFAALGSEPPSVAAHFTQPESGAIVVPRRAAVPIHAVLTGEPVSVQLSVGAGSDPVAFEPLPLRPDYSGEGELARWDVAAREDGPYVLRLEVSGGDGAAVVEFVPFSLERNRPRRISSLGPAASAPSISGSLVAWESPRELDGEPPGHEPLGREIFVSDWRSGDEWRAVSGPGEQREPEISGERLAWFDDREVRHEIRSCRLARREEANEVGRLCRDALAAAGAAERIGLAVSGDRLIWSEGDGGPAQQLRGCRWRGGRCRALALPSSAGRQTDPLLDRAGLWWLDWTSFPPPLVRCTGGTFGSCEPQLVATRRAVLAFHASGSLLAWRTGDAVDPPLFACRVAADGSCARTQVATLSQASTFTVSGNRVVWDAPGPGGDSDVFFCEHDPDTGECPVQRITGSAAEQRRPDVSGARVVWEDDREGELAIFGIELPSLAPLADRVLQAGRTLRVAVRASDPARGGLRLSAAFADGAPLESRGARFEDLGNGSGVFRWTPGTSDVGEHRVRVEARSKGGLASRRTLRIEVREARPGSN